MVFNGNDFGYWKNRTHNYLLNQGHAIWKIVQETYVISATLDNVTQGELQSIKITIKPLISLLPLLVGMYMIVQLI
jgi:hypothetical protein